MSESSIFLERLYKETLQLLNESRSYVHYAEKENDKLPSNIRLRVSYETLRVTARLSQVMTWLLTEKAVEKGEIPVDQARGDGFAIYGGSFCEENPSEEELSELPEGLRSLVARTGSLYQRALRLEEMLKRGSGD